MLPPKLKGICAVYENCRKNIINLVTILNKNYFIHYILLNNMSKLVSVSILSVVKEEIMEIYVSL